MTTRVRRRFLRTVGLIAACAALVATAAGAASAAGGKVETAATASPFRVLVISPFSGAAAALGNAYKAGIVAAGQLLNTEGGILGHHITLKFVDDGSNPINGVTMLQNELASGTRYNLVITANTAFIQPLAPVLAKVDALVATVGSADSLFTATPYPNLFGFSGNLEAQEQGVVRQMVAMKVKNIGIIAASNSAGMQSTQYLKYVAEHEGITAHVVLAPPNVADATPQLQQLQADGAQNLVIVGFSPVVGAALAARAKLGWDTPAFCDYGCAATNWATVPASSLTKFYVETIPQTVIGTPESRSASWKFFYSTLEKYTSSFPLGIAVPMYGWQEILAAKAAATKARSIDGIKMVGALETIHTAKDIGHWVGPLGLFDNKVTHGYSTPHLAHMISSDFVFVNAKPQVNGMIAGPVVRG